MINLSNVMMQDFIFDLADISPIEERAVGLADKAIPIANATQS